MDSTSTPEFSLLWPNGQSSTPARWLDPQAAHDLNIEKAILAFCPKEQHREWLRRVLLNLSAGADVIRYRQAIIEELLERTDLVTAFKQILPKIEQLNLFAYRPEGEKSSLQEITYRAGELELLVECIQALEAAFDATHGPFQSQGLQDFRHIINQYASDATYRQLVRELPEILSELRTCASITIGVNLDPHLRPEEATLLSVNQQRFTSSKLLDRFFDNGNQGLKTSSPLHTLPVIQESDGIITAGGMVPIARRAEPMMVPLFRDLSEILEKVTKPISKVLKRYSGLKSRFLVNLQADLVFYTAAVDLVNHMRASGLPLCRPEVVSPEERVCQIDDCYNLNLALHLSPVHSARDISDAIVLNSVDLGPQGRIVILTGPNQGGKTTFMQAVGLAQVLAQAGLFVPGSRAEISPVDGIYTHYPLEERLELGTGRFGDEAQRISAIFERVTRSSLVLLNESLFSTNPGESLYLAQDLVRVMSMLGLRAIYTTHLHALAASVEEINASTPGDGQVVSMVASPVPEDTPQRALSEQTEKFSFRIVPGPPIGRSFAEHIARQYGISYQQLLDLLKNRGVLE